MPFKKCNNCGFEWDCRDTFLRDPMITIIGYQANFKRLESGSLYFNHSCKGTLTIPASEFVDLYDGPIFQVKATHTEKCPGYCLYQDELRSCPAECECAYIREVIAIIKNWKGFSNTTGPC